MTVLDLSFNKIKHIKNVSHLVQLTDLFLVQNKISKIEGLEGLSKLRNLELGANRIRVRITSFRCGVIIDQDRKLKILIRSHLWKNYGLGRIKLLK